MTDFLTANCIGKSMILKYYVGIERRRGGKRICIDLPILRVGKFIIRFGVSYSLTWNILFIFLVNPQVLISSKL